MRQHQASEAPSMFCLVFPLMFTSDVRRGGDRDNNREETLKMAVSMLRRTAVFQREDAARSYCNSEPYAIHATIEKKVES